MGQIGRRGCRCVGASGRVTEDVARQTTVSAVEIALSSEMTDLAGREPSGTELDFAVAQLGSRMEDTGKHLIGPAPWLTCAGC